MSKTDELNYLKFRYTFNEGISLAEQMSAAVTCIGIVSDNALWRVVGIERLNSYGRPATPHVHIFWATTSKIGAVRKAFTRSDLYKNSNGRKGNALYSLSEDDDVEDVNRFFRYVFKENRDFPLKYMIMPPDFNLELEAALAKEERERQIERNLKSEAKRNEPSTQDKLFEYLAGLNEQSKFTCKIALMDAIIHFYESRDSGCVRSTIVGYHNTAMIRFGLMTRNSLARKWCEEQ